MAKKRGRGRNGQHGRGAGGGDGGAKGVTDQRVEHLRASFAKFRRVHRPQTRIPQQLREEALAALECGTPEQQVRRACGVTAEQLQWWRRPRRRSRAQACDPDAQMVRVFPVVEGVSGVSMERSADDEGQQLELRIGGWAICIRHLER